MFMPREENFFVHFEELSDQIVAGAERFRAVLDRQPDDQSATLLLGMCLKRQGPRAGDSRLEALERLKTNYEERAYWQLKAVLAPGRP